MDISLSNVATAPTSTESSTGSAELDQTTFLNLLTTQLQYQDPMDPQSSEQFVAQLAQFSSLEQLMSANESLAVLNVMASSLNNASMTQLIGKSVIAQGNEFQYNGEGEADLHYDAASTTSESRVTVYDASGTVVYSEELGSLDAGEGTWTWDGSDTSGNNAGEGTYTFEITGSDSDGNEVEVTELIEGVIDGMSYESGTATPSIGDVSFDLSAILRVGDEI